MKELIKVAVDENGKKLVNGRDLHEFLEIRSDFRNWIKNAIRDFGFTEGEDYGIFGGKNLPANKRGGHNRIEYGLSLNMSKELSMLSRTERGKQARLYFIQCEKKLIEHAPHLIPQTFTEALRLALKQQEQLEEQETLLLEQKPKADFYDAVVDSKTAIPMGEVAKLIGRQGVGRNTLFQILRHQQILMWNNVPYQSMINRGYFKLIEQTYKTPDGEQHVNTTVRVYQKGVDYIRRIIEMA
jgi:anti-repressor protein